MPTDKTVKPLPDHECKYCKTVHVGCCSKACVLKKNPNYPLPSVPTESRRPNRICSNCGVELFANYQEAGWNHCDREMKPFGNGCKFDGLFACAGKCQCPANTEMLGEFAASSSLLPVRPDGIFIPLKLKEKLCKFLNRRMEQDRWLDEQSQLCQGLDDCADPNREVAAFYCGMCHGSGRDFNSAGEYQGPCFCVKPAKDHPDSYAYKLASLPVGESRQPICKGSFEYDKEAQKYSDVCSLCGIHADQHPEEITLENSARQICASLGILPALPDELAPVMEQLQKFAKHYAASSSEPRIVKIVRTCCAKCHKKISECICPERQGTRCNHPWPCSKEDDSDYDDELGLVESREEHPTVDTILRAKRKL